jgi:hypothetical protein
MYVAKLDGYQLPVCRFHVLRERNCILGNADQPLHLHLLMKFRHSPTIVVDAWSLKVCDRLNLWVIKSDGYQREAPAADTACKIPSSSSCHGLCSLEIQGAESQQSAVFSGSRAYYLRDRW